MCKHDLPLLVGTADGIVCEGCGKKFPNFDAVLADTAEKPKRKKKEAKTDVAEH